MGVGVDLLGVFRGSSLGFLDRLSLGGFFGFGHVFGFRFARCFFRFGGSILLRLSDGCNFFDLGGFGRLGGFGLGFSRHRLVLCRNRHLGIRGVDRLGIRDLLPEIQASSARHGVIIGVHWYLHRVFGVCPDYIGDFQKLKRKI